jgi:hypothetical protein
MGQSGEDRARRWHPGRDGGVTVRPNADFEHRFRRCSRICPEGSDASDGGLRSLILLFNDLVTHDLPEAVQQKNLGWLRHHDGLFRERSG